MNRPILPEEKEHAIPTGYGDLLAFGTAIALVGLGALLIVQPNLGHIAPHNINTKAQVFGGVIICIGMVGFGVGLWMRKLMQKQTAEFHARNAEQGTEDQS